MKMITSCGCTVMLCVGLNLNLTSAAPVDPPAEEASAASPEVAKTDGATPEVKTPQPQRVSLAAARERAGLMHELYAATLDVMHHRYFHGDRAVVPARAMEDVFAEMKRTSDTQARWISVNMKAMSIDHEPETGFEKKAARELSADKSQIDIVEDGFYRQARTIPLTSGCISCHGGFFKTPSEKPKFAGLVISVPVHQDKQP